MTSVRQLAELTPTSRNRAVDLYRAIALVVVVVGHWISAAVWVDSAGVLHFTNILVLDDATHWITWIVQVMPVFFIVGGFANWRSYHAALRRGEGIAGWITLRYRRLMTPIVAFLATWVAVGVVVGLLGVDQGLIRAGSAAVVTPLWFLAVYLVVITAVPLTVPLWERLGWWSVTAGLGVALGVDAMRAWSGNDWIGWLNFIFVWLTAHQLGYAWATERQRPRTGLLATGLVGLPVLLVLATVAGPYPNAMVGVVGFTDNNHLPPTAVLLVLGLWQYCLVRLVEPTASSWMRRSWAWTTVVGFHTVMMTVYVWHLPVLAIVVLFGYATGVGFDLEPLTALWWVTRPIWILILGVALSGVVLIFGRFEVRVRTADTPRPWVVAIGVVASITAIATSVTVGLIPEAGLMNWWIAALFGLGVVTLGAYPARRAPDLIGKEAS